MDGKSQAELELSFDGDAVHDGKMNVRDLAPSMLAVGALFDSTNKVLNGSNVDINVNVKATSASSFHIIYEVSQLQGPQSLAFQDLLVTAVQMKELIFAGSIALFALIKLLNGRKPKVEKINDNLFKLTIGNETYEVP